MYFWRAQTMLGTAFSLSIHTYICVFQTISTHTCICISSSIYIYTSIYLYLCIHTHTQTYPSICLQSYKYTRLHLFIYIHITNSLSPPFATALFLCSPTGGDPFSSHHIPLLYNTPPVQTTRDKPHLRYSRKYSYK